MSLGNIAKEENYRSLHSDEKKNVYEMIVVVEILTNISIRLKVEI